MDGLHHYLKRRFTMGIYSYIPGDNPVLAIAMLLLSLAVLALVLAPLVLPGHKDKAGNQGKQGPKEIHA
jgi:hypothetical protein